jgi:hypothetical protein
MKDEEYNEVMTLIKSINTNRTTQTFENRVSKNWAKVRQYDEEVYWPEMHKMRELCTKYGHKEGGTVIADTIVTCKCCGIIMEV